MNSDLTTAARPGTPSLKACYGLIVFVSIATGLQSWLLHHSLSLSAINFGSGVFLAALYIVDRPTRGRMLAAMFVARAAGLLAAGRAPGIVFVGTLVVAGQAWFGAAVLRIIAPNGLDFTKARAFGNLALVALLVAPPSGYVIDQLLTHASPALLGVDHVLAGAPLADKPGSTLPGVSLLTGWILPHALGIVLAVPLTIGFATPSRLGQALWLSGERMLILASSLAVTAAVFTSHGHTYLFLVCPTLVWAGLRLGVRDTASALLVSLTVASIATALGNGPVEVLQTAPGDRLLFLELAYLCACACIMPIAASLEARRRLEADLAQSLEFTEQVLTNMHEIAFRTDAQGQWTFLNSAWEQITGYSISEGMGKNYSGLLVDDDLAISDSSYSGLISGEVDDLKLQQRIQRRDGQIRHIEINVRAIRSPAGEFLGSTGTIRDMSEYRRYIEALETSERRFRQLCDTAPVGIIRCDRSGAITYANKKLELIVSSSLEQLAGTPWLDILGNRPGLAQQLGDTLLAPGPVFEEELCFCDGVRATRWQIVTATGEFDADSALIGYIAAVKDITARKAAQVELAKATEELQLLANNINDVIFRIGLDGTCLYVTPSVREMIGVDPQRLIGTKHCLNPHPDDRRHVEAAFLQLAQGTFRHFTLAYRVLPELPGVDYIWLEANIRLIQDKDGNPYELVAAVRDITERKQLEIGIIEARHRAEQATLARSAFIANLSHEIRTPMNGVIGLTELLLGRDLDAASRRYVKLISESGAAMMQLLNDILDISKIDSGGLQLSSDEFDVHKCVANALNLMTASAGNKQLELRMEMAPGLPRLMLGDGHRLRQILTNLIGNAVKFTEIGHVLVHAQIDGDYLEIRVEDTGIGIPEAQQIAVFKEFVQAHPEISSGYGGTGLGLSISRRISEAMGGSLNLTSQLGKGTTLILRIPARFIETAPTVAPTAAEQGLDAAETPLRVLIAEDNRTNQIIIKGMLQRLGHSAALAQDGEEVIAMVEQAVDAGEPFDLVLMDVQMLKMDGIEATARLRLGGFDAVRLPIIAVTANGYREDIELCLAAGMQDHLTKPVRLADLKAALTTLGRAQEPADQRVRPAQIPIQVEIANDS